MFKFLRVLPLVFTLAASLSFSALDFSEAGTLQFAKRVWTDYPEAHWLTSEEVKATLQGEKGTPDSSWSLRLTGKHYIEFERTVSSMLILHALYQGDEAAYTWFTKHQKESDRLSRKSFDEAAAFVKKVADRYSVKLLETNLLLGDLGKTPEAHKRAQKYGITEGDHDIFLAQCLEECPDIFPTYASLNARQKRTIQSNAGLLHFGHLLHEEGTAIAMLSKLKKSGILGDPDGFDFELVCHLCDISAVLAHVNNEGSLTMTAPLYQSVQDAIETVHTLAKKSENEALLVYSERRLQRLFLIDLLFPTRDILARLAAMMRLTSPADGQLLYKAWEKLPESTRQDLIKTFNPFRTDQNIPTPTYVPAVLTNLRDFLSKTEPDVNKVMDTVIGTALPWVVRVIRVYEENMGRTYPVGLTLNFNPIGGAVRDNPHILDSNPDFKINPKTGEVTLS